MSPGEEGLGPSPGQPREPFSRAADSGPCTEGLAPPLPGPHLPVVSALSWGPEDTVPVGSALDRQLLPWPVSLPVPAVGTPAPTTTRLQAPGTLGNLREWGPSHCCHQLGTWLGALP